MRKILIFLLLFCVKAEENTHNYTGLILKQMNGEITRQDVLNYKCCDKKSKNEENKN